MAAIRFEVCDVPVIIKARAPHLIALFADYFHYYRPQLVDELHDHTPPAAPPIGHSTITVDLKTRRHLPPLECLIPPQAELLSETGVIRLWREPADSDSGERFYFHMGTAAFRVDPERDYLAGLITPEALSLSHVLTNTYTLFALLLLLRSHGLYHLHAAAVVSPRNQLYLICGAPHSGKTTLATALGLAGWRPISDDSLLVHARESAAQLIALKKSFHLANEILDRWPALDGITRHHRYHHRTCVAGLEFFGATALAEVSFGRVDHILIPQITGEAPSSLRPMPAGEAVLKLAEQSMFFQLWRKHTEQQLNLLAQLARTAACHRLSAGTDILADPRCVAEILEQKARDHRSGAGD